MKSYSSDLLKYLRETGSMNHKVLTHFIWVGRLYRNIMDRRLKKTGVYRSQHQILMIVSTRPNISQREIADLLDVSTATIAVSLKKLEKGGYIKRIVDSGDNRFNQICLTEMGKDMVEHSHYFFKNVEEQFFCGFSEEELNQLDDYLDRLGNNLLQILDISEREDIG